MMERKNRKNKREDHFNLSQVVAEFIMWGWTVWDGFSFTFPPSHYYVFGDSEFSW